MSGKGENRSEPTQNDGLQDRIRARAMQIHADGRLMRTGKNRFRVPSQSQSGKYYDVIISDSSRCTCTYHTKTHEDCKHIIAAGHECEEERKDVTTEAAAETGKSAMTGSCRLNCKCSVYSKCSGAEDGKKCKCKCRRDAKAYDAVTEGGRIKILLMIMELMDMLHMVPYELGVGFGGRRGYDPKKMFAIIVLKTLVGESCRGMVGYLNDHPDVCRMLAMPSIPSKNTIARAYKKISSRYVCIMTRLIAAEIEIGDTATDSTGKSKNMYEPWRTVNKADGLRKGYLKLHAMIDTTTRLIIDLEVTKSNVSDITIFRKFLERFDWAKCRGAFMCADAAYLARDVCTTIEKLGYMPLIMPKINSVARAKGHPAWHTMIKFYQKAYKEFIKQYGQRSIVESMFGAIKKVYGNGLRMKLEASQEIEILLEALCHNATYMHRYRFSKSGCIYPEQELLEQYRSRNLDSNRITSDREPDTWDVILELVRGGMLQVVEGHSMDDICRTLAEIQERYRLPLFYPSGSDMRNAVLEAVSSLEGADSTNCSKGRMPAIPCMGAQAA